MASAGNAAANTENFLDLTGQNVPHAPLPDGFTAKGIVALTFSIVAGLLGVGVIAWYGMGEMGNIERTREERKVEQVAAERGVVSRVNTNAGPGEGANPTVTTTGLASGDGAGEEITRAK